MLTLEKNIPYKKRKDNYQSNTVTKSRQKFTLQEKKIVAFIINQIDRNQNYETGQNVRFEIPLSEIAPHVKHEDIKKAAKSLFDKEITTENDAEKQFKFIRPFPLIEYDGNKGTLTVVMFSEVVLYFIGVANQYTKYHLETFLGFDSVYSQRLYEIIMMYWGRKESHFKLPIERLQFLLNSNYPNFKDLRRRVLDVAQSEIREKAGMVFTYTESKKEGKKIVELEFHIKSVRELALDAVNEEAKTFFAATPEERNRYARNLLNNYKFTKKQQSEILGNSELFAKFMAIESEIVNNYRQVDNPTAYMATALGFGKK